MPNAVINLHFGYGGKPARHNSITKSSIQPKPAAVTAASEQRATRQTACLELFAFSGSQEACLHLLRAHILQVELGNIIPPVAT